MLPGGHLPLAARVALGPEATAHYEDSVRAALDALGRAEDPPALDPYERMAMLMPRMEAMRASGRLSEERYEEIRQFLVAEIERSEGSETG